MTANEKYLTTSEYAKAAGLRVCDVHNILARHRDELKPAFNGGRFFLWTLDQVPKVRAIYFAQRPQAGFRKAKGK